MSLNNIPNLPPLLEARVEKWSRVSAPLPAEIVGNSTAQAAEVYIKTWSPKERTFRAFKSLAVWWILAAIALFIPLLHFFLVPLFFFAGLLLPLFILSNKSVVLGGAGTCPFCSAPFDIAHAADRWPLHDVCSSCGRHVQIVRKEAADR